MQSNPEQLRFPPVAGLTVRADFDGGALSSDFGAMLLRGVDRQTGLTQRLATAFNDRRHPGYVAHSVSSLFAQRIYQIGCAYADGNDAHALRRDPMFKLALERAPLDERTDLASAPTLSRLENAATARDIYRMAAAFVDHFIASYTTPPRVIVLDMDHTDSTIYGQQELGLYCSHYQHHCYLPLLVFEGLSGKFITAALRPGKRPKGKENAAIMGRVVKRLRQAWPKTHIILRGDGHFSCPELMAWAVDDPLIDFIFGLGGNLVVNRKAAPYLTTARAVHETRCANARRCHGTAPQSTRCYHDFDYAAGSWPKAFRVVIKAEVSVLGDKPRYVVTSLDRPSPEELYRDLYCARGQDENFIKMMKNDLACDRTSDHRFLANHMRLFFSAAAYVLHHRLREEVPAHSALAQAQPTTIILKLFKIAVRVVQYKDRVKLHLPDACPFKSLLQQLTERLYLAQPPPLCRSG